MDLWEEIKMVFVFSGIHLVSATILVNQMTFYTCRIDIQQGASVCGWGRGDFEPPNFDSLKVLITKLILLTTLLNNEHMSRQHKMKGIQLLSFSFIGLI